MLVAIFFYGYINKMSFNVQFKKAGIFICGFIASLAVVFITMKLLGHYEIYLNSLKMVFSLSQETKGSDGLEGTYRLSKMLYINFLEYAGSIRSVFLVIIVILISGILNNMTFSVKPSFEKVLKLINYLIVLVIFAAILKGLGNHYRLILLFTGISLVSGLLLFNQKVETSMRLLIFLGGFILLVHPIGSSEGITSVILYSLWISFPISIDFISKINKYNINSALKLRQINYSVELKQNEYQLKLIRNISFSLIILACVYDVIKFPSITDMHDRKDMTHPINNKLVRHIFTTQGRAEAINQLIEASSQYIKPGDVVFAFDCMPLYHYMTETKSYVRNPCIWYYTTGLFVQEMKYAESKRPLLPVVIKQKINLIGSGSGWPEMNFHENYLMLKRNQNKNLYVKEFLIRNNYREVWSSPYFEIYVPEKI
jgi:hypothetical protein